MVGIPYTLSELGREPGGEMAKKKILYVCEECGHETSGWREFDS